MRKYGLLFWMAIALVGCGPKYLERSGIPIVWGMRIDEAGDETDLADNLAHAKSLDMNALLVELPLRADSFGLPVVATELSPGTIQTLRDSQTPLSLAFSTTHSGELFPTNEFPLARIWLAYLEAGIDTALGKFSGCKLERVILASEWGPMAESKVAWERMLTHFRERHPATKFSIGGRTEALEASSLGSISDEIAIDYAPIAGEELKGPCRVENQKITELALQSGKSVFIYRANIIGESPALQIQNRLRFWQAGVTISGICLNTLYPKIAALDGKTYYGLADDPEALDFLQSYRLRPAQ